MTKPSGIGRGEGKLIPSPRVEMTWLYNLLHVGTNREVWDDF